MRPPWRSSKPSSFIEEVRVWIFTSGGPSWRSPARSREHSPLPTSFRAANDSSRSSTGGDVPPRLKVVGDITCDIDGSVECTVKATDSEEPVYVYDAAKDAALMGIEGNGPVVMAVYNLPAELPIGSSAFFSGCLKKYVPVIALADFRSPFDNCELPPEVRKAVILYSGELTPDYKYLSGCLGPLIVS
jgi:hypothetical protein